MCLAVPGKVLSVEDGDPAFRTANVDFCGVRKTVNLAFTPEVKAGRLRAGPRRIRDLDAWTKKKPREPINIWRRSGRSRKKAWLVTRQNGGTP